MRNHTVYVPSQFTFEAEAIALELAGGVTVFPGARGLWKDPSGTVHQDSIDLVQVFETDTQALEAIVRMLFRGGEQAVAYVTNGVPYLRESTERTVQHETD